MNEASDSKFVTRNRGVVNDNSRAYYSGGSKIVYNTKVLKCNPCDKNDAYIHYLLNVSQKLMEQQ